MLKRLMMCCDKWCILVFWYPSLCWDLYLLMSHRLEVSRLRGGARWRSFECLFTDRRKPQGTQMNGVNLGEDPGYRESKHPILNIHVHAHSWREKLSLSSHSRDTTNGTTTCTQGKWTVTEGSCKEKHEKSTREEPGFHWRCRSTFQRWMAVHSCLKKGCDCSSVAGGWWATGE